MTEVFILHKHSYGLPKILGVFTSLERAQQEVPNNDTAKGAQPLKWEDFGGYWQAEIVHEDSFLKITPFTVTE